MKQYHDLLECYLEVGDLVHTIGDAHIYNDHFDQVKEQLSREEYPLPRLSIDIGFNLISSISGGFKLDSASLFTLTDYNFHDTIKANMAV